MPYAHVQQKEFSRNAGAQTSIASGAFSSSLTAGNLMICHVWYIGPSSTPLGITLSGAGSPTWVEEAVVTNASSQTHFHSFYALNVPGGTTAEVVATATGNMDFPAIYVAEYSGFKTSGARLAFTGQHQATPTTSTDAVTSGLLGTLSEAPAGILAFSLNENSDGTPAAGTSFTALTACHTYEGSVTASSRPEHRRVTATTSVAGTFTAATNGPHKTAAWAFSEAAGSAISHKNFMLLGIG